MVGLPSFDLPSFPGLPSLPDVEIPRPNLTAIGGALSGVADGIRGGANAFSAAAEGGLRGLGAKIGDIAGSAVDAGGALGQSIINAGGGLLQGVGSAIGGFFGGVGEWATDGIRDNFKWIALAGAGTLIGGVIISKFAGPLLARNAKRVALMTPQGRLITLGAGALKVATELKEPQGG